MKTQSRHVNVKLVTLAGQECIWYITPYLGLVSADFVAPYCFVLVVYVALVLVVVVAGKVQLVGAISFVSDESSSLFRLLRTVEHTPPTPQ